MKYTVVWTASAEKELGRLWLGASDRKALAAAADAVDALLAKDPWNAGESRFDNVRIVVQLPIVVMCEVIEADRQVRVVSIWQPRRKH